MRTRDQRKHLKEETRANRHDHLGRRVQKITPEATHTYFYDGWLLIKEVVERSGDTANEVVERCLMLGQVYSGVQRVDISSGGIKSFYSVLCNVPSDAFTEVEVRPVGRHIIDSAYSDKNNRGYWDY